MLWLSIVKLHSKLADQTQLQVVGVGLDFAFPCHQTLEEEGRKKEPKPSFYHREWPFTLEIWWLPCWYLKGVCKLSGGCLVSVWCVSGGCLDDVWEVSMVCPNGVLGFSWCIQRANQDWPTQARSSQARSSQALDRFRQNKAIKDSSNQDGSQNFLDPTFFGTKFFIRLSVPWWGTTSRWRTGRGEGLSRWSRGTRRPPKKFWNNIFLDPKFFPYPKSLFIKIFQNKYLFEPKFFQT